MKIIVPFTFTAKVIMPKCRKPIDVLVRDSISVNIKEFQKEEVPTAFKIGESEILYDGKKLWELDFLSRVNEEPKTVAISTIKENTENYGKNHIYSSGNSDTPFFNFWWKAKSALEDGENVETKKELESRIRIWQEDNRAMIVKEIRQIAKNTISINNFIYKPIKEPRYVVVTFGLGRNHGGTGMFVDYRYNDNIKKEFYFNALEYEQARVHADNIANNRGDDKSVPVTPNGGNIIEVLIEEAVKINTNKG